MTIHMACSIPVTNHIFALILSGLAAGAVRPLAQHQLYAFALVPICVNSLELQQPLCVRTLSGVAAAVRPSLRHKSYEREREIVRRQ